VEKATSGSELYNRANFHAHRREISVFGQKYISFLIGEFHGGCREPSHVIHHQKALGGLILSSNWHLPLPLTVFEIFGL